jgi:predicted transcriptional regulator
LDNNDDTEQYTQLTAEVVSAYVANNSTSLQDLPNLIASVHTSLKALGQPTPEPAAEKPTPHMPIKKTVTPDYLVSLEDGRQYKSLKRHLSGRGLTPAEYKEKWGLPRDYPMVAPSYAAKRSELARAAGLGQKRAKAAEPELASEAPPVPKRGRPKKTA